MSQKNQNRLKQFSDLQEEASECPGIQDLMIVLEHWKQAHKVEQEYEKTQKPQCVMVNANVSDPEDLFRARKNR